MIQSNEHLTAPVTQQILLETEFWDNDPFERPGSDSIENVLNKGVEAAIFSDIMMQFKAQFSAATRIVEVGGGQGWASCIVKRMYPAAHVTLTDAVPAAVVGRDIWQRVFNCTLDAALPAPAQSLALPNGSADLIFCYAAAHHFVDHEGALAEAHRLLTPGGWCLWLYEPTSSKLLHAAAERRVNKKRPDVHEHVMVPSRVLQQARAAGFDACVRYWPNTLRRGRFETLYYLGLSFLPSLCSVLPCTAHFVFRRAR